MVSGGDGAAMGWWAYLVHGIAVEFPVDVQPQLHLIHMVEIPIVSGWAY